MGRDVWEDLDGKGKGEMLELVSERKSKAIRMSSTAAALGTSVALDKCDPEEEVRKSRTRTSPSYTSLEQEAR